jgi:hypothetical protein
VSASGVGVTARRWLTATATLANAVVLLLGLWLQSHPKQRSDEWAGAGMAATAVLNSAAIFVSRDPSKLSIGRRVRRIALIVNAVLIVGALAFAVVSFDQGRVSGLEALASVGLLALPALTVGAILSWRSAPEDG